LYIVMWHDKFDNATLLHAVARYWKVQQEGAPKNFYTDASQDTVEDGTPVIAEEGNEISLAGGRWPRLLHDGKRGLVRSLPGTEYSEYKVCIMAFSSICFMDVRTFLFWRNVSTANVNHVLFYRTWYTIYISRHSAKKLSRRFLQQNLYNVLLYHTWYISTWIKNYPWHMYDNFRK
jgi:hypothetical protein